MDKEEKILEIINVNKSFGKTKIIKNLNLSVNSGEIFGFLGPNGAGKSTTIKMIVGLLSIDSGDIYINGYSIKKDFKKAMKNVGAIVENPDLYEYLTGYENLMLIARIYRVKKNKLNEIIELMGLKNRIKDKVKKYSIGMKQRLGLAMALIREPKLLILDEPTNGLDPSGIHDLRDLLKRLAHDKGICIFVSSHLLSEIELMCDRVAIINKGEIIKVSTIKDIEFGKSIIKNAEIYTLNTDNNEKAKIVLKSKNYKILESKENLINIAVEEKDVKNLVGILSDNKVSIYEISKKKQSLEEDFLNLTSGGSING